MPKKIESIEIHSQLLKDFIQQKKESLTELADELGVSKQSFNFWLQQNKLPVSMLGKISLKLKLSKDQLGKITKEHKSYKVLFRTRRNVPVMKSNRESASDIGKDFFLLHEHTLKDKKSINTIEEKNPVLFARKLRRQLRIDDKTPLTTTVLIKILEQFNIHVLFVDFDLLFKFKTIKVQNVPAAFCLKENESEKYAIVVNMQEHSDDILWIILHELTHIFAGHLDMDSEELIESDTQEVFSNKVASEILTPSNWFDERRATLTEKFESPELAIFYADEIARKLNSSFQGVLIALDHNKIIGARTKSILWKAFHLRKKKERRKVVDLIGASYSSNRYDYWQEAFTSFESFNYLKFQNLLRKGLLESSVSIDRAAEVLGVDDSEAALLKEIWTRESQNISDL